MEESRFATKADVSRWMTKESISSDDREMLECVFETVFIFLEKSEKVRVMEIIKVIEAGLYAYCYKIIPQVQLGAPRYDDSCLITEVGDGHGEGVFDNYESDLRASKFKAIRSKWLHEIVEILFILKDDKEEALLIVEEEDAKRKIFFG